MYEFSERVTVPLNRVPAKLFANAFYVKPYKRNERQVQTGIGVQQLS